MELLTPQLGLIFWTLFSLLSLALMLAALISILRNHNTDSNTKLTWVLLVLFLPLIGTLLYFFIGRKKIVG